MQEGKITIAFKEDKENPGKLALAIEATETASVVDVLDAINTASDQYVHALQNYGAAQCFNSETPAETIKAITIADMFKSDLNEA